MHTTPIHTDFFPAARAIVEAQVETRAKAHKPGVCWSGMSADLPAVESVEAVAARLAARDDALAVFRASPRGRFLRAVHELSSFGWEEAETARAIYSRTFADERLPVRAADVGRAIRVLADIDHSSAREAISALSDLIAPPLAMAAE